MNITEYLTNGNFASDIRFTYNITNTAEWVCALFFTIGTVWMFKDDKPASERLFFAIGIFFVAVAVIIGRNIDMMREGKAILVRSAHLLTTFNMSFIFLSGILFIRALTQHWIKDFWKYSLYGLLGLSAIVFTLRVILT